MQMQLMQLLTASAYLLYIYIYIFLLYILYLINLLKRRRFEGMCYVYISLVDCVAFSCNTWAKK
jgi:hypothetical protein